MINTVYHSCGNYLEGFQDLSTYSTNSYSKNVLGFLKVASYFTVVLPIVVGVIYGISSLLNRVSVGDSESPENQKTSSVSKKVFNQTIEEQLEQFFKSSTKTQKLFNIDGFKIGIIFDPSGEAHKVGFMTIGDPIVLVSDRSIPDEVKDRVAKCMPENTSHSTLSFGSINGRPTFAALGFK